MIPKASIAPLAASVLSLAACNPPAGDAVPAASATAQASDARPIDHVGKNELLEGPERAFALKLPRGMRPKGTFVDVVYVEGEPEVRKVIDYVAARVRDGTVSRGERSATFDGVRIPEEPTRYLRIVVGLTPTGATKLEVHDVTKKPAAAASSDAERLKRVGLSPNGKLLPKSD